MDLLGRIARACSGNHRQASYSNPMVVEINSSETRFISDDAGNGLFATVDLEAGDVVLRIRDPYILIPRNNVISALCYGCLAKTVDLKACQGCKVVAYCSKSCQTKSWKIIHKFECKVFRKCKDEGHPVLPTPVRGLVQVLVRHPSGVDPDPGWSHLELHKKSLMANKDVWQDVELQATAALKYTGLPMSMMDIATSIICAFKVNAFSAVQQDDSPIGLFFDPLFSTANHSCVANTLISFDGRRVSFKALRPIGKGEPITIYYVDPNQPLEMRQRQLQERYFFTCKCPRCIGDWNAYDTFLQNPHRGENSLWIFNSYEQLELEGYSVTLADAHDLAQHYETTDTVVSMANAKAAPEAAHALLQVAFNSLKEVKWGLIIAATPYPLVLRPLIDNYIAAGEIEAALVLLLTTAFHAQPFEFPEPWHPVRVATLRSIAHWISEILSTPKYSLHRLRAIPSSLASEVELFPCVCALLLLIAHYIPRSHGSKTKIHTGVQNDLTDFERYANRAQYEDCIIMFKTGIWDGNGRLLARKYFGQLERLADINLMSKIIDSVDCAGNGHNGAFRLE